MSDPADLEALLQGDVDLVRRDLRGAKLSGMKLTERDFSEAHLHGALADEADFSKSIFSQAQIINFTARMARFVSVVIRSGIFLSANFSGSDFRFANCSRSHFTKTNMSGVDLRGADFQRAVFNEETSFEGAIVDKDTLFDDAKIFRPISVYPAFRFYRVERGVLVRRDPQEIERLSIAPPEASEELVADRELREAYAKAIAQLDELYSQQPDKRHPGIGHNSPPDSILEDGEHQTLKDVLVAVRQAHVAKDTKRLSTLSSEIRRYSGIILVRASHFVNLAAEEFAKESGKILAKTVPIMAGWLAFSGHLDDLFQKIVNVLGFM